MRARDLVVPLPILDPTAPAAEAARLLASEQVDGVLVVDEREGLLGVVTDTSMLAFVLPRYVTEDQALARVVDEGAADLLWQRLQDRTTRDLLAGIPDQRCEVDADAKLIEVGAVMVRNALPLVAVRGAERLLGGITSSRLLTQLLAQP